MIRLGHSLRLTDRQRSRAAWVDPLATLPAAGFLLRTCLHPGDLTPQGIVATPGGANTTITDTTTPGGLVLTQSDALLQGLTQYVNDVPVLRLDGAGDHYPGSYSTPHSRGDFTIVYLVRRASATGAWQMPWFGGIFNGGSTLAGGVPHLGRRNNTTQWGMHDAWTAEEPSGANYIDQATNALTWQVSVLRGSGGVNGGGRTLKQWCNGTTNTTTQSWTSVSTADWTIGGQGDTDGPATFNGDIHTIGHWREALTDGQIEDVIMPYLETIRALLL